MWHVGLKLTWLDFLDISGSSCTRLEQIGVPGDNQIADLGEILSTTLVLRFLLKLIIF